MLKKHLHSSELKNIANNSAWLISERLFSMVLMLIVNIVLARYLAPEQFGQLNYVIALFALITPLSAIGLNAIVTKELLMHNKQQAKVMATAITFRLLSGCFFSIVFFIMLFVLGANFSNLSSGEFGFSPSSALPLNTNLLVLLLVVNVFTAFQVIDFWFQAQVKSKFVARLKLFTMTTLAICKLAAVYLNFTLNSFIVLVAIESFVLSCGFLVIFFVCSGHLKFSEVDFNYGISLLKKSKWLLFSSVASIIYLKIDQIMLANMVSNTEVGVYAVASRLSEVWYFLPSIIVSSFFPKLINAKKKCAATYKSNLQTLCDLLFVLSLVVAVLVTVLAPWFVPLLFGEAYKASVAILTIHIWAGVFVFMRALLSKWLINEDLYKYSLVTHGVGAVINVLLNLYLIPLHQGVGAAVATVVSYMCAGYLSLFIFQPTRDMAKVMTRSLFLPFRKCVIIRR